jgi:hypothetical protein
VETGNGQRLPQVRALIPSVAYVLELCKLMGGGGRCAVIGGTYLLAASKFKVGWPQQCPVDRAAFITEHATDLVWQAMLHGSLLLLLLPPLLLPLVTAPEVDRTAADEQRLACRGLVPSTPLCNPHLTFFFLALSPACSWGGVLV